MQNLGQAVIRKVPILAGAGGTLAGSTFSPA
jgi:hypothetical protein